MQRLTVAMLAACPFPAPRGTPVRIYRMAETLAGRGHDVHVITYHLGSATGPLSFRVHRSPRVPTYRKLSPGPSYQKLLVVDPLLAGTTLRVLGRHRFDVIHAHHFEGLLVGLVARGVSRLPVVFDAHTLLRSELPYYKLGLFPRVKRAIGEALDRRLPRHADHVIAVSDEIRDRLVDEYALDDGSVSVVPNGVECDHFAGTGGKRNDTPRLVFAGNLAPYQGIELMLDAFAVVRARRPELRLQIISDDSLGRYTRQARTLGVLEAIDVVPGDFAALPVRLAGGWVALNPRSHPDGAPLKLLNYMAAGVPIVSCEGSGGHLGRRRLALTARDGDARAFAAAIERLLDDPGLAARLAGEARRFVTEERSWSGSAAAVEAIYHRLLDR